MHISILLTVFATALGLKISGDNFSLPERFFRNELGTEDCCLSPPSKLLTLFGCHDVSAKHGPDCAGVAVPTTTDLKCTARGLFKASWRHSKMLGEFDDEDEFVAEGHPMAAEHRTEVRRRWTTDMGLLVEWMLAERPKVKRLTIDSLASVLHRDVELIECRRSAAPHAGDTASGCRGEPSAEFFARVVGETTAKEQEQEQPQVSEQVREEFRRLLDKSVRCCNDATEGRGVCAPARPQKTADDCWREGIKGMMEQPPFSNNLSNSQVAEMVDEHDEARTNCLAKKRKLQELEKLRELLGKTVACCDAYGRGELKTPAECLEGIGGRSGNMTLGDDRLMQDIDKAKKYCEDTQQTHQQLSDDQPRDEKALRRTLASTMSCCTSTGTEATMCWFGYGIGSIPSQYDLKQLPKGSAIVDEVAIAKDVCFAMEQWKQGSETGVETFTVEGHVVSKQEVLARIDKLVECCDASGAEGHKWYKAYDGCVAKDRQVREQLKK